MNTTTTEFDITYYAETGGEKYYETFLGKRAVYTNSDGEQLTGTITRPWSRVQPSTPLTGLVIKLDKGGWANLGHTLQLIED